MQKSRKVVCALTAAAVVAALLCIASPCYAEGTGGQGGSTYVTLGLALGTMLDLGLRAGLEYRWPAGPGVAVAVGTDLLPLIVGAGIVITGEALAVLPLSKVGRSGALDLALGVPTIMYMGPLGPGLWISVGGAARLHFGVGSRWAFFVRAGGGYLFNVDRAGFHPGADTDLKISFLPDLEIGTAFRL